ncbi:MAG: hypothetical protein HRU19_14450 [Pseudobacteriovorax sp.]|nr:hypothetical protein [Pseudobacteriovorax sp.]
MKAQKKLSDDDIARIAEIFERLDAKDSVRPDRGSTDKVFPTRTDGSLFWQGGRSRLKLSRTG